MNKYAFIIALFIGCCSQGWAQADERFEQPGQVVSAYYTALSTENDSARAARLNQLFAEGGTMNATLQWNVNEARQQLGTVSTFLTSSNGFYDQHKIDYQEIERTIDYYQDLASVNSTVIQQAKDESTGDLYEQWLWLVFDMLYADDRWFISSVSWVNAVEGRPIEDAMLQDTLWHQPED